MYHFMLHQPNVKTIAINLKSHSIYIRLPESFCDHSKRLFVELFCSVDGSKVLTGFLIDTNTV